MTDDERMARMDCLAYALAGSTLALLAVVRQQGGVLVDLHKLRNCIDQADEFAGLTTDWEAQRAINNAKDKA